MLLTLDVDSVLPWTDLDWSETSSLWFFPAFCSLRSKFWCGNADLTEVWILVFLIWASLTSGSQDWATAEINSALHLVFVPDPKNLGDTMKRPWSEFKMNSLSTQITAMLHLCIIQDNVVEDTCCYGNKVFRSLSNKPKKEGSSNLRTRLNFRIEVVCFYIYVLFIYVASRHLRFPFLP